jgi:hypothetical protein
MSFRDWLYRQPARPWIPALALWVGAVLIWADRFRGQLRDPNNGWLFDWHVYAAGAHDLFAGTLYRLPLVSPYKIPVDEFNLPPGAALTAAPFIAFPDAVGGALWVALNIAALAAAAVLTARIVGLRPAWLWSGAAFFLFTVTGWSAAAYLGNNTNLVLLLVAGCITAHLASRSAMSGVLLGVAIASKLWPAALLVPLARERSWRTVAWAVGSAALILGVSLLWLGGLDVIRPMIAALSLDVEPRPGQTLLAFTWLRIHTGWWPDWGGYVVALLILLIPSRGVTGYGIAILAGMAAIPNLWLHYVPTVVFGAVLAVQGRFRSWFTTWSATRGTKPVDAAATDAVTESGLGP